MSALEKQTTPILRRIEEIVSDVPGWTPPDQLLTLFNLAYLTADLRGDILEIGSWCGRSTAVLGLAAKLVGNTKLVCIDLFPEKDDWKQNADGSYSFSVRIGGKSYGAYWDQRVWKEPFENDIAPVYAKYSSIHEVFRKTIKDNNLEAIVTDIRGSSDAIKGMSNARFKLAFLDADHGYEGVCTDIRNAEQFLIKGGWICFDDAFSHYDGVDRAIIELVINSGRYEFCQQMTRKLFIARKKV
jgi:predicted O-methyltransferase YrrM